MEEQEVLKPIFATYPPYNILNVLRSGAIQEIKGDITRYGTWVDMGESFYVILPYNDKNTVIKRYINFELAINVDWNKVTKLVLEKWKNNQLGSEEIEKKDITELLLKIGVVSLNGQTISVNSNYQMNYKAEEPTPLIDITNTANPRSQKKEEK